jgi:oligopeptide transport system ATP-binding protein
MAIGNKVLLSVKNLKKHFPITSGSFFKKQVGVVKAVDDISFEVFEGETLGLVGESGCGKSTTGRTILQLYRPTSGQVIFANTNLVDLTEHELRKMRRRAQMIFQDPYSSLNPRATVNKIISEPLQIHKIATGKARDNRVKDLLNMVGLNSNYAKRYPHELSGGQRQRIAVARALASDPEFIVCDEPISALDVSIQAQIVNLLEELQDELNLTYLFIAHDLSMIRHISRRVAVMYLGKLVELTERDQLYNNAQHPYTKALLSAVPIHDPLVEAQRNHIILEGDIPSPANPPQGCNFNTRCPVAERQCFEEEPVLQEVSPGIWCSCHLV